MLYLQHCRVMTRFIEEQLAQVNNLSTRQVASDSTHTCKQDTIHIVHKSLPDGGLELCKRLQALLGQDIYVLVQIDVSGLIHTMIQRKDNPINVACLISKLQHDLQIVDTWTTGWEKEMPAPAARIHKLFQLYEGRLAHTVFEIGPARKEDAV